MSGWKASSPVGISWSRPSSRSRSYTRSGLSNPRTSSARRTVIELGTDAASMSRCTAAGSVPHDLLGEVAVEGLGGPLLGERELGGERREADHRGPPVGLPDEGVHRLGRVALEHPGRLLFGHRELVAADLVRLVGDEAGGRSPSRAASSWSRRRGLAPGSGASRGTSPQGPTPP